MIKGVTPLDSYSISFGKFTETDPVTGEITLTEGGNKKFQVIKLTHELSNRINRGVLRSYGKKVEQSKISLQKYAHLSAQTEVDGEINQIKVTADIGFRYFGKKSKAINSVIDNYSKNKSFNLRKIVAPSTEHILTYINQDKRLQQAYQNRRRRRK